MTSKYTDLGKNNIELLMFPVGLQTFKALSGDKKKKNCNTWPIRNKMSQLFGTGLPCFC